MSDLHDFLASHTPLVEDEVCWPPLRLRLRCHLLASLPALDLVTSVRSLVFRGDALLVVRDPNGVHLLPGGRREAGESLLQTLEREVQEETGWTISQPTIIAILHYHHLTPRPAHYPYPYPDFAQLIFQAEAATYHPDKRDADGYELGASFHPVTQSRALPLSATERALLEVAVQRRGRNGL